MVFVFSCSRRRRGRRRRRRRCCVCCSSGMVFSLVVLVVVAVVVVVVVVAVVIVVVLCCSCVCTCACTCSYDIVTPKLEKLTRDPQCLPLLTWKWPSRHNGLHFCDIESPWNRQKVPRTPLSFLHFSLLTFRR